jgi:TetR/AcrR family transcriptional regulator, regulator of mycofactocin system
MTMVTSRTIAKHLNRQMPREDLRQRISDAALSLFKKAGFDAVSVDQIVTKAGVSKGAFFNFFPTKADALIGYFRELDGSIARLRANLDPHHPLAALKKFFTQTETLLRAEGTLLDSLWQATWTHPSLMNADRASAERDRRGFAEFFSRARASGTIDAKVDPAIAADMVGDLWTSSILMWLAAGRSYSFAGAVAPKLRLLFLGLGKTKKQ